MTEWEVTARQRKAMGMVSWLVSAPTPLDALREALVFAAASSVEQPAKPLMLTQPELDLLFQMCGRALQEPDVERDPLLDFPPRRPLDRAGGAHLQQRIADLLDT